MQRIVTSILVAAALALIGPPTIAPIVSSSIAYAQSSDKEVMDHLQKVKKMVSEIETSMKTKKMKMDAAGRTKSMQMLMDVEKMLNEVKGSLQSP